MPKKKARNPSRLRTTTSLPHSRASAHEPRTISLIWLKAGIAILLLPLCVVATQTFLGAFSETSASTLVIGSAPLWFFFVGAVLWMIAFFGLPRPL